jgi:hypothetical protein
VLAAQVLVDDRLLLAVAEDEDLHLHQLLAQDPGDGVGQRVAGPRGDEGEGLAEPALPVRLHHLLDLVLDEPLQPGPELRIPLEIKTCHRRASPL